MKLPIQYSVGSKCFVLVLHSAAECHPVEKLHFPLELNLRFQQYQKCDGQSFEQFGAGFSFQNMRLKIRTNISAEIFTISRYSK